MSNFNGHHITAMTNSGLGYYIIACRCGAVFHGDNEMAISQYVMHREDSND